MFPTKRLQDVASFHNDRRVSVRGSQRLLRRGPYPLYVEAGTVPFDDYFYDGTYLVVGSLCNVENAQGCFGSQLAQGKFAVTPLHHVIAGANEDDTTYLHEVLSHTPVRGRADAGAQSIRLSENSLRHLPIPWPAREARRAFVAFLNRSRHDEQALREEVAALLQEGARIFQEACSDGSAEATVGDLCHITFGRGLDANQRAKEGRYPVASSQGILGRTDEAGVPGPCFVVGQAGQFLIGRLMEEGAFPLADSAALSLRDDAPLSPHALTFALMEAGIHPRLQVRGHEVQALALPLSQLASLKVAVLPEDHRDEVEAALNRMVQRIRQQEEERNELMRQRARVTELFLQGDEAALAMLPSEEGREAASGSIGDADADDSPLVSSCADGRPGFARARHLAERALEHLKRESSEATLFDAVWEIIPLVAAQGLASKEDWQRVVQSDAPAAAADEIVREAVRTYPTCQPIVELLENGSALPAEARNDLVRALDESSEETRSSAGDLIRSLAGDASSEEGSFEAAPAIRGEEGAPDSLAEIVASVAAIFKPDATSAFDPFAGPGLTLSHLARKQPELRLYGETVLFADAMAAGLAALCDRASLTRMECGESLVADAFQGDVFDIVASVLPCNAGEWAPTAPDDQDPRWQFGKPPRNKANLAWLQHAYHHRAPQGIAVLAMANATLHEARGCEPAVRKALIESGCVQAVIALPGRLFSEGQAPVSILVLGEKCDDEAAETLFVNLLDKGIEVTREPSPTSAMRVLPAETFSTALNAINQWRQGRPDELPSFARAVPRRDIAKQGVLTPWTYTN